MIYVVHGLEDTVGFDDVWVLQQSEYPGLLLDRILRDLVIVFAGFDRTYSPVGAASHFADHTTAAFP